MACQDVGNGTVNRTAHNAQAQNRATKKRGGDQGAGGPEITARAVRGLPAETDALPTPPSQGGRYSEQRIRKNTRELQQVPKEALRPPGTSRTASCGAILPCCGRPVGCRHPQRQRRCKCPPAPLAGRQARRPPPPSPTQTTPEPDGPGCGSDAGIAATWRRLWNKASGGHQREVWQSLTQVKD